MVRIEEDKNFKPASTIGRLRKREAFSRGPNGEGIREIPERGGGDWMGGNGETPWWKQNEEQQSNNG